MAELGYMSFLCRKAMLFFAAWIIPKVVRYRSIGQGDERLKLLWKVENDDEA